MKDIFIGSKTELIKINKLNLFLEHSREKKMLRNRLMNFSGEFFLQNDILRDQFFTNPF